MYSAVQYKTKGAAQALGRTAPVSSLVVPPRDAMVRVLGLLLPRPPLTLLCRRTPPHARHHSHSHAIVTTLSSAFTPTRLPPPPSSPLIPFHARCLMAKASLVSEVGLTKSATPVVPEIAVSGADTAPAKWSGDLLVLGVFDGSAGVSESGKFHNGELAALDELVGGLLSQIATEEDFSGKTGQSTFHRIAGCAFKRVGLVGLGKLEKADATSKVWRSLGESVATASKTAQANSAAVTILEGEKLSDATKHAAVTAITSGAVLGSFEDMRFKSEFKKPLLKTLHFLGFGAGLEPLISQTVQQSVGVILAKQLVNAPPNVLLPSVLASEAEAIAEAHSDVMSIKILEKEECEKLGMGAYLGVSAASTNPPKFIHLQYNPSGSVTSKLAIVGKGLTFDSGGYNLKTGPGCLIELMKFDMGGAAAVLGCAKAIAAIKPAGVEVHFIVAACENMISGGGMRPGDILTASNGKTIEVNNTDAEGRLTLADALVYASKLKVDKIVDLATLTGACIIALGNEIGGMFTPFDELAEELSASSKRGGEKLWRMPMEESYWEMMKSGIADMVNTGGRPGGSITAALFLKHYVDENIPWAHLDIAGPVWKDKTGGTGFAVATLVEWVVKHKTTS